MLPCDFLLFQSSPAPRRGRYAPKRTLAILGNVFQSSPAPRRGRYTGVLVSVSTVLCFNPRPRRGAGATGQERGAKTETSVSILARAEARALQRLRRHLAQHHLVSILARAEARALRDGFYDVGTSPLFQSSPAPRRGRYFAGVFVGIRLISFNPRPRRGAGATCTASPLFTMSGVFQSSPAPRRGRYKVEPRGNSILITFQSSPAPRRGRYFWFAPIAHPERSFNPRPRRGAGATSTEAPRFGFVM